MTRDEFSRCIALVGHYWPHGTNTWTADVLEAWESLLLDLDPYATAAAIQVLATEGREWPPPPGVVRRKAHDLTDPLPSADEAWGEIRDQIRRVGSTRGTLDYRTGDVIQPAWSHPLIGQTADRLGWDQLCRSENEMADRAHFLRIWADTSTRQRTLTALPPATRTALAARGVALPDLRLREITEEAS